MARAGEDLVRGEGGRRQFARHGRGQGQAGRAAGAQKLPHRARRGICDRGPCPREGDRPPAPRKAEGREGPRRRGHAGRVARHGTWRPPRSL